MSKSNSAFPGIDQVTRHMLPYSSHRRSRLWNRCRRTNSETAAEGKCSLACRQTVTSDRLSGTLQTPLQTRQRLFRTSTHKQMPLIKIHAASATGQKFLVKNIMNIHPLNNTRAHQQMRYPNVTWRITFSVYLFITELRQTCRPTSRIFLSRQSGSDEQNVTR